MTANIHSPVDRSCNNWLCCFRGQPEQVAETQAPPTTRPHTPPPGPFDLVRTVAMRQLKDVEVLTPSDLDIEFDAVHIRMHHTPKVTPEPSIQE